MNAVQGTIQHQSPFLKNSHPFRHALEIDPTNGLVAGENLIRVAVTRDPAQAVPIGGTFAGEADYLGMEVEVRHVAELVEEGTR